MIIIISPAKKLQNLKTDKTDLSSISFPEESKILVSELQKYKPKELSLLMDISPKLAELNFERYINWHYPFITEEAGSALFMFNGDVYRAMNVRDFSENELQFTQENLRIISGLYGILKPFDKILPYRLEMGTKLKTVKGKNLYDFWGNKITEYLNKQIKKNTSKLLINLASNEYFKAINPKKFNGEIITPVFKEQKGNDYKVVAVHAKKARGLMCRYIIKNKLTQADDLKGFSEENYSFDYEMSSDEKFVFTR